jgi:hypothetical protein
MATGTIIFFDEAKAYMQDGGWNIADDMKCAVLDNTTVPVVGQATPTLATYTEVTAAGSYTAGGTSLGDWQTMITEAAGTVTYDSATNPTWAQNASNDVDAYWGLIYNDTTGDQALAFIELGGPVDMTAGSLTITWNASGIATLV